MLKKVVQTVKRQASRLL